MKRYTRPLNELWKIWEFRARNGIHPFDYTLFEDDRRVLAQLTSYDRDEWAAAFSRVARTYEQSGAEAQARGDVAAAKENFLRSYGYYRMARYPTTNSPGKIAAYKKSQELFFKAAQYFEIPVERVEIAFPYREGEGDSILAYLRIPPSQEPAALLLVSGGIDTFKEDSRVEAVLALGIATLSIDIPGVGDAPIAGSVDAERLFGAILDWVPSNPKLDPQRVGYWGGSTGGYWALKIAHTHAERLACVVSQGGCAHHAFEPEWIEKAQWGEYPFELAETLAYAFGRTTFEAWVDLAPELSLVAQGVLDRPCAPLLLVNGIHDSIFPIEDYYLVLQRGSPKTARFFETSHMGYTRDTLGILMTWIGDRLSLHGQSAHDNRKLVFG